MDNTKYKMADNLDHTMAWDWDQHVSQSYVDNGTKKTGNDTMSSISDVVEAGSTLILAGPASLSNANKGVASPTKANTGIRLVPIGLIENASINISKPVNRIFEIGSKISYIIPGRTVGGINLSRVFFDGASLLKILYAGEIESESADLTQKNAVFASDTTGKALLDNGTKFENISSGNVGMNLASSFFDHPFGMGFVFKDQDQQDIGFIYFEGCVVTSYGMSINAGANVLIEGVNIEFTKIVPVVNAGTDKDSGGTGAAISDRNIVLANSSSAT